VLFRFSGRRPYPSLLFLSCLLEWKHARLTGYPQIVQGGPDVSATYDGACCTGAFRLIFA
jgi:hypothetical protein